MVDIEVVVRFGVDLALAGGPAPQHFFIFSISRSGGDTEDHHHMLMFDPFANMRSISTIYVVMLSWNWRW